MLEALLDRAGLGARILDPPVTQLDRHRGPDCDDALKSPRTDADEGSEFTGTAQSFKFPFV